MNRRIGGSNIKKHVLIDISNIIHKSIYILKKESKSGLGNLSLKVFSLVLSALDKISTFDDVRIFFDGKSTRRNTLYPAYKGNRAKPKENDTVGELLISHEIYYDINDVLKFLFKKAGFYCYHSKTDEADDCIGSFCRLYDSSIKIIVSDDKDFFFLLKDPRTVIFKYSLSSYIDADSSKSMWGKNILLNPQDVLLFKSLYGDASDNIKGIPRLPKSFVNMLSDIADVDDLFTSRKIPIDVSRKINENKELVELNHKIVSLNLYVDLNASEVLPNKNIPELRNILKDDLKDDLSLGVLFRNESFHADSLPDWYVSL